MIILWTLKIWDSRKIKIQRYNNKLNKLKSQKSKCIMYLIIKPLVIKILQVIHSIIILCFSIIPIQNQMLYLCQIYTINPLKIIKIISYIRLINLRMNFNM